MKRIIFIFLLISGVFSVESLAQDSLKTFKAAKYSLQYPAEWKTSDDEGILNFFPEEDFAALTVSSFHDIDFPLDKTKELILEMSETNDKPENVKMTQKDGFVEFNYEYTDTKKETRWVIRVIRKDKDLYLFSINCLVDKWDSTKDALLKALNSFKLN